MYFISNNKPNQIKLDKCAKSFNYQKQIYPHWKESFKLAIENEPNFICDLSAALVTQLTVESFINKNIFSASLLCCERIMENLGYESLAKVDFLDRLSIKNQDNTNYILIPGCQNDYMLKRRVEKAGELCNDLKKNFEVVFSGRNPNSKSGKRSSIPSESAEMIKYFTNYMKKHKIDMPRYHELHHESASNNTNTNISIFFNNFIDKPESINLYIVSSSFHLIRLAKEVEIILKKENKYKEKIKSLIFIGAESRDYKFNQNDKSIYLKLMLVDVFKSMLVEHPKNK